MMVMGGSAVLIPFIEEAHRYGIHVITVDYLPNNRAHEYSDEYYNISVPNKEEVLEVAKKQKIDGISSFACDAGAVSAAYVAEQLGLPYQCTYDAAVILQDKSLFRDFLTKHNFNVPTARGYQYKEECLTDLDSFNWPVIVKPRDSAGSKGVTRVESREQLTYAIKNALHSSINKGYIIEDYIEAKGLPSGAECFFVNGVLKYAAIYDQCFDVKSDNRFVPIGERWPSKTPAKYVDELKLELQRLSDLLHLKTGLYNVEFRISTNDILYIMEVTPRAGGNGLAEMLGYAADINLIEEELKNTMGMSNEIHTPMFNPGIHQIYVLHSRFSGLFDQLIIKEPIKSNNLIKESMWIKKGDEVHALAGGNNSIGTLFLRFNNEDDADEFMNNSEEYINILLK